MERLLRKKLKDGAFVNVNPVRSRVMGAIRGKHNRTTELQMMRALRRARCIGWRRHVQGLPGAPDFYFPKAPLAVFVDGCFWHGCKRCGHIPKTRRAFWKTKIARNNARHLSVAKLLQNAKIPSLRVWEHALKTDHLADQVAHKILVRINP